MRELESEHVTVVIWLLKGKQDFCKGDLANFHPQGIKCEESNTGLDS